MSEVFVLGISLQAKMSGTKVTLSGWSPGVQGKSKANRTCASLKTASSLPL